MTTSKKLIIGGLAAGLIAFSGATSAFAVPRTSRHVTAEQSQTENQLRVTGAPETWGSYYPTDTMQRDGDHTGRLGDGIPSDQPWSVR